MAPEAVKRNIGDFIARMRAEKIDLKSLGLRTGTRDDVLAEIARVTIRSSVLFAGAAGVRDRGPFHLYDDAIATVQAFPRS